MTLFKSDLQEHLTEPNPELTRQVRASHDGMAHFAGTGPRGLTCRECQHWDHGPHDYRSKNGKYRGLIKPAPCRKFRELTGEQGKAVPDDALACRHFVFNTDKVPARYSR